MTQAPRVESGERLGLIAGNGRFPIIFADNARKLGYHVSAVAHEGETVSAQARAEAVASVNNFVVIRSSFG